MARFTLCQEAGTIFNLFLRRYIIAVPLILKELVVVAMAGPIVGERTLRETPTWAVALVCAVFVIISIIIEHSIHSLGKWFQRRQKKAMTEALEKIKAELMLLGFLSLLITVGTKPVSKICIPASLGDYMLPCKKEHYSDAGTPDSDEGSESGDDGENRRRLLGYAGDFVWRRGLAAPAGGDDYCSKDGKIPLVSASGIHQLHLFIFALALFHVLYSVVTIALAKAKLRKWKSWEKETSSLEYQFTNDPSRFRLTHQTSFVKRHTGLSTTPGIRWIVAFFRQFFASVTKVDYLTMRHGFINAHFAPDSKFDFHRYIKRSMEDDFKVVVGVSIPLWICSLLFLLLNVYGWYTLSIISFTPLIILLIVGAKLEIIIMEMAQQIQDRTTVVKGAPVVEPTNKFFWFNRPGLILFLIHFTLFQNAFQMAYFLWIVYEFKLESCFHENLPEVLTRVCLGVALQILCSYITFPLYALVTQMGSHMKTAIFEEQTTRALKNWQKAARQRNKIKKSNGDNSVSVSGLMSGESTPSRGSSPLHLLHKHKPVSSLDLESAPPSPISSPRFYRFDADTSEIQERPVAPASGNGQETRIHINNQPRNVETHAPNRDFSFSRSLN